MAAAHYPGGLRPHPPGLRPGPRPSSEMAPGATAGTPDAGHPLAGRIEGCRRTPAQVKGASGVAGDDAEASPLTSPGNPRRNARCPTRRCPGPRAAWRAQPATRRGSWTAQLDRCSIKQKRKNDQTVVPPGGGTVEDNDPPRQEHLGRIESPPNSGCSRCAGAQGAVHAGPAGGGVDVQADGAGELVVGDPVPGGDDGVAADGPPGAAVQVLDLH